jgi:thioredoxin 1
MIAKSDIDLTNGAFENQTAMIFFWADWCTLCLNIIDVFDEIEKEAVPPYDSVALLKVDFEPNPALCEKYDIMVVPTVVAVKNGRISDIRSGFREKWEYTEMLMRIAV